MNRYQQNNLEKLIFQETFRLFPNIHVSGFLKSIQKKILWTAVQCRRMGSFCCADLSLIVILKVVSQTDIILNRAGDSLLLYCIDFKRNLSSSKKKLPSPFSRKFSERASYGSIETLSSLFVVYPLQWWIHPGLFSVMVGQPS